MALKKNKGAAPSDASRLDLTPMIDVTFQLIIFFILVTDMSQQELEILTLPIAPASSPDEKPDPERIVVNIVNPENPDVARDINPNWPPIFIKGRQMPNLEEMRKVLRIYADPRRFPDTTRPQINPGSGLYPSVKPLLIRCDEHQVFGWVQAVMQYCSFTPAPKGTDPKLHQNRELNESPLIYKIELAAKRKDPSEIDPKTGE